MKTIILAAGLGQRMKSTKPKPLHTIFEKPILFYVMEAAAGELVVVAGHQMDEVKKAVGESAAIVEQKEQLGTGHAVMAATSFISPDEDVLVLCGDTPLVTKKTIELLTNTHREQQNGVTGYSTLMENPKGYGRILRKNGQFGKIVEEKVLPKYDKAISEINEINTAIYVFKGELLLMALKSITNNNTAKEYYLTDTVEVIKKAGHNVQMLIHPDSDEFIGINDRVLLAEATAIMKNRINQMHMLNGVTIVDPANTYIGPDVEIGQDTTIYPGVWIEGRSVIGQGCEIGTNCKISNSQIADNVVIQSSIISDSSVGRGTTVGPFAYLRAHTKIGESCRIGDYVEVKNSEIGNGTKAAHLTYIGDSDVGSRINFGCGTVTGNYDGKNKYRTVIEDNVFIGCNTNLIAPVTIKEGAYIAAGSTITEDVPENSLAIARARQVNKDGWTKKV